MINVRWRLFALAAAIVAAVIIAIDYWYFESAYVLGPVLRILVYAWRGVFYALDVTVRTVLYQIGWRRIMRPLTLITMGGIGLTYLVTNPKRLKKIRGWKGRIIARAAQIQEWWYGRHFVMKVIIVIGLIALQVSVHWWLLLFPVGFLITAIAEMFRRGQLMVADEIFGKVYWTRFRAFHTRIMRYLRSVPFVGKAIAGARSLKLMFKCGWRLWRYDPRFRDPWKTGHTHPIEGRVRLIKACWLGEWRRYHTRHLLAGKQAWPKRVFAPRPWWAEEDRWYAPFVSTVIVIGVMLGVLEYVTDANVLRNAIYNTLDALRR
ncbi:MAG: hypothetical protein WA021_05365 [Minisyncoccia bacterium]